MKKLITTTLLMAGLVAFGQNDPPSTNTKNGEMSHGIRSTGSLFSASGNYLGVGAGWQIRYRLSEQFNTEWFFDWITTDLGGLGYRYDAHIGESMIIYPGKKINEPMSFTPYVLGGFCGDYTKIQSNLFFDDELNEWRSESNSRWSFATQLGAGTHFNITERFDISLSSQYILHFGKDIHTDVETNTLGQEYLHVHQDEGGALEGHLFITVSANYVIADLAKNR